MSKFTNFIDNIQEKISELTTLEIKTIVGDFSVDSESEVVPAQDAQFRLMHTKIDLIGGDITTHISRSIMNDEFIWVRNFHAAKEEKAHELVQANIRAVVSLFGLFNQAKGMQSSNGETAAAAQLGSGGDDAFGAEAETATDDEISF